MNKKRWVSIAVIIVLLVVYIRTDVVSTGEKTGTTTGKLGDPLSMLSSKSPFSTETYQEGLGQTIAILNVDGTIESGNALSAGTNTFDQQVFLQEVENAFKNPEIKAIILAVDSPGGGVYESDQIYQKLKSLKDIYQKPLVVSMGSMAASGGYYISMPADKILANRFTMTGSIGVIMSTYNYSQLADKWGIEELVFKSGKNKDILNPMRDTTQEEMQIMQGIIDEYYGYFVDVVAEGRKMDRQAVISIADGRVYTASQAKSLGLIDQIGDLDGAITEAAKMINETNPKVIKYKKDDLFNWNTLLSLPSSRLDFSGIKEDLQNSAVPTAMYLYR
ncbi:signal peptide peptidase SppA [Desulfosporosinus meridiei]|uniref:Signal peptide peptidase SppA, 36K type n=1 Tax=Desulfosporosinus meridiei (strain ATCC BAA-275 / DSM 13257 / KCTC 12902 / NCIMB 13706 / S10) TaxID=768704 RepID=J7J2G1_DESMD|nr:signal peptide peptidase SppA [Desulfosporosinus meridiei]AFQ45166.1 signal peptide peptidase SppA, 36K type [Desulfosporosinus meridiei DSM 13257]